MTTKPARLCRAALFTLAAALASQPLAADTLLIDKARQSEGQNVPPRGMSMNQVEERFGPPREVQDAVGKPPITRWVYQDFVVYFEHQYVIHSVVKRK